MVRLASIVLGQDSDGDHYFSFVFAQIVILRKTLNVEMESPAIPRRVQPRLIC